MLDDRNLNWIKIKWWHNTLRCYIHIQNILALTHGCCCFFLFYPGHHKFSIEMPLRIGMCLLYVYAVHISTELNFSLILLWLWEPKNYFAIIEEHHTILPTNIYAIRANIHTTQPHLFHKCISKFIECGRGCDDRTRDGVMKEYHQKYRIYTNIIASILGWSSFVNFF